MEKVFDVDDGIPASYPFVAHNGVPNKKKSQITRTSRRQVFNYLYHATEGGMIIIAEDGRPGRPRSLPEGLQATADTKALLILSSFPDINPSIYPGSEKIGMYGAGLSFGKMGLVAPGGCPKEEDIALLCDTKDGTDRVWRFMLATAQHLEKLNPILGIQQAHDAPEEDARIYDLIDEALGDV